METRVEMINILNLNIIFKMHIVYNFSNFLKDLRSVHAKKHWVNFTQQSELSI